MTEIRVTQKVQDAITTTGLADDCAHVLKSWPLISGVYRWTCATCLGSVELSWLAKGLGDGSDVNEAVAVRLGGTYGGNLFDGGFKELQARMREAFPALAALDEPGECDCGCDCCGDV